MAVSISAGPIAEGMVTVAVEGEVDVGAAEPLREAIKQAVKNEKVVELVLDLCKVSFLDSTGIGVLVEGRRLADECATRYRVVNATGIVKSVLDITGVLAYLCDDAR